MFPSVSWRLEWNATLRLGLPIVMAQVGISLMGLVDTLIAGFAGAECLAGVGAGAAIFWGTCLACMGTMAGIDVLAARAHGAGDERTLHDVFAHVLGLAAVLSFLGLPFVGLVAGHYEWFGGDPVVVVQAKQYLWFVLPSLPMVLFYAALQRYWQAREFVASFPRIIAVANLVNLVGNLVFALGWGPFPALGTQGIAIATVIGRAYMLGALLFATRRCLPADLSIGLNPVRLLTDIGQARNLSIWRDLWGYGLPAGAQVTLEVGAFTALTTLATRFGVLATAAHQIVMAVASFTFMVPLGLASAGAYRIGHLLGGGRPEAVRRAGWVTLFMGTGFMLFSGLALYFFPRTIFGLFRATPDVLAAGLPILLFAALFQVADGVQVVTTGLLRGLGNTRASMWANLVGHYPVGLALGVYLGFVRGYNLTGLWAGVSLGLLTVAITLLWVWYKHGVERWQVQSTGL